MGEKGRETETISSSAEPALIFWGGGGGCRVDVAKYILKPVLKCFKLTYMYMYVDSELETF